jgi:hypothetical protein
VRQWASNSGSMAVTARCSHGRAGKGSWEGGGDELPNTRVTPRGWRIWRSFLKMRIALGGRRSSGEFIRKGGEGLDDGVS